jgi:hypothetical protein
MSGAATPRASLILAAAALLALAACSKGLHGAYACTGIPDINALTLKSDGSYTSNGNILGHATPGSGKFTYDARQVTLEGSYKVEGLTVTEPNKVIFDRQRNGDLKSLFTVCKRK